MILGRREFIVGAVAASAWPMARAETGFAVRVASNQGAENAALQQLLADSGFAKALSLEVQLVESRSVSGPMEALLNGDADICMISAFAGVLPVIAEGKPLRLVSAAMLLPALAVYSAKDDIKCVEDLSGRTVGVGPLHGLLHILMLALLRKKGIDAARVRFVVVGSNAQVLEAVASGKVDAGLSGVAGKSGPNSTRVLNNGRLWLELPEYTYELSYASAQSLEEKPEALARCLAAYTRLFRYLSRAQSKAAYLAARRHVEGDAAVDEGEAVWNFIQRNQPYSLEPGLSPERVMYLQQLNIGLGVQSGVRPFDQVVDLAPAQGAKKLLSTGPGRS